MCGAAYVDTGKSACATLRVAADSVLLQNDGTYGRHNFSCQPRQQKDEFVGFAGRWIRSNRNSHGHPWADPAAVYFAMVAY